MTHHERQLLILVASYAAQELTQSAEKNGTTSNWADEIRSLMEKIGDNEHHKSGQ